MAPEQIQSTKNTLIEKELSTFQQRIEVKFKKSPLAVFKMPRPMFNVQSMLQRPL